MKILKPNEDINGPVPPEIVEEIARLLAGPDGHAQLTPDGWVYQNPYHEEDFEVGFPKGQLIANGMRPMTALIVSEAFHVGGDMREAADDQLTVDIAAIITRLETHSQYGKG